jgi:hypothetical protein
MTGDIRGHAKTVDERPWHGRYAEAPHAGVCQVCGRPIRTGDPIVVSDAMHRASHFGCGTVVPRRDPT